MADSQEIMNDLDKRYVAALSRYQAAIDEAHRIIHDPFKAPELNLEPIPELLAALWELQVTYLVFEKVGKAFKDVDFSDEDLVSGAAHDEARADLATKLNLCAGAIERDSSRDEIAGMSPTLMAGLLREASKAIQK